MDMTDLVIFVLLIAAIYRGLKLGAVSQITSAIGFFVGLLIGSLISPHIIQFAPSPLSRAILTVVINLGLALILLGAGEFFGNMLDRKLLASKVKYVDRGLGSVVAAVTVLATVWLGAAILVSLPFPSLQNQLRGSAIVSLLNRQLPPAPNLISSLNHLIYPNGFPKVFTGNEPTPPDLSVPLNYTGPLAAAAKKDEASVVKIEGAGCGGTVEGSGFVFAPGLVATNAHVVAGVDSPYVFDKNGQHQADAIWFDPNLDLAVLAVSDLAGKPLNVANSIVANGTGSVVLGYPGNSTFTAQPAAVLDRFIAVGRNIYDKGSTQRDVYEIKANIIPGNSGGPMIIANGSVIGIVFAESTVYNHVGYALTSSQVMNELNQSKQSHNIVSTGACAE